MQIRDDDVFFCGRVHFGPCRSLCGAVDFVLVDRSLRAEDGLKSAQGDLFVLVSGVCCGSGGGSCRGVAQDLLAVLAANKG